MSGGCCREVGYVWYCVVIWYYGDWCVEVFVFVCGEEMYFVFDDWIVDSEVVFFFFGGGFFVCVFFCGCFGV